MRANSSPFFLPDDPSCGTVRTVWPASDRPSALGTRSSSNTRIGHQGLGGEPQCRYRLLAGDGRENVQELRERVPAGEVVKERPQRHAGADEYGGTAEDVGVAVDNGQ